MGKINLLSFEVANLIAAGEVVDRPSSAIKELLENAIDAGSTQVTLEIQRGGVTFIRVADNGCGMEKDDLIPAITRHSTSKIRSADDLTSITTLGFRGEALAAIAAVSRLRIYSKLPGSVMGALLESDGGQNVTVSDTGCPDGTTIIVEDLFFNVPARRKFLKKDSTEAAAIGSVIEKIALSHPEVSFKFISDGEIKFITSGSGDLRETMWALFGRDMAQRTLPVDREEGGIRVVGYVSESDMFRSNRNMENFFINGRYVKSKTATAALEQAFTSKIPADKFPACVLNILLNPGAVDVNVHPAKLEVKFANEKLIFDAVYYAVLSALEAAVRRPELRLSAESAKEDAPPKPNARPTGPNPVSAFAPLDQRTPRSSQMRIVDTPSAPVTPAHANPAPMKLKPAEPIPMTPPEPSDSTTPHPTEPPMTHPAPARPTHPSSDPYAVYDSEITPADIPDYVILGEAFNTYVIVQLCDRLLMVDKHAAHERILFDELCRKMRRRLRDPAGSPGQLLMAPLTVDLLAAEAESVEEYADNVRAIGFAFTFEKTGVSTAKALITQIPETLEQSEAAELFHVLADRLSDASGTVESTVEGFFESRLWQASCKAAIKGGRLYDVAHLKWICDRLLQHPDENNAVIRTCPHGRPVAFEIKKSSIDRQFARLG